jgi:hypothetical protein
MFGSAKKQFIIDILNVMFKISFNMKQIINFWLYNKTKNIILNDLILQINKLEKYIR